MALPPASSVPSPGPGPGRSVQSRRWLLALSVSAAVVMTSPFVADVRDALRRTAGGHYAVVINGIVGAAVALCAVAALRRIRDRRLLRYSVLAAAIGAGAIYVWATALPSVERFHFVEYGIVTYLFYRAVAARAVRWPPAGSADSSIVVVPVLAALIVATADEWVQWFVPRRYGEVRDIFLNLVAIGCGLAFSVGAEPPRAWQARPTARSLTFMTRLGAAAVVALGAFLYSVHLGHWVVDEEIGAFRSRYTAPALRAFASDRAVGWGSGRPQDGRTLAREDQYLTEGLWHVQMRNEAWAGGAVETAWRENLILETYFSPVLRAGHAWPAVHRADAESRRGSTPAHGFVSRAERYPILTWPAGIFIGSVVAAVFVLLAISFTSSRWC